MPIYDIFESREELHASIDPKESPGVSKKDRLFSSLTARLLFFILWIGDLFWMAYAAGLFCISGILFLASGLKWPLMRYVAAKQWLALKRASVCGLALFVSLFSPALGIMLACTYFLMYDKTGIQEVVPASLQEQFQEFLK